MTKQADGGRVGMFKGGATLDILKGIASLFKKKKPKKTEKFGPPRDPERDYETAAALKESRKRYDLERKNLSPLQDELDKMLMAEKKRGEDILNELKITTAEIEEKTRVLEEFNRIADEKGIEAAIEAFDDILNPKRTLNAAGGRVGALKGGLMSLLKQFGMKAPDKIADKKQIENVIRDPITDLERIYKDRPSMGVKATPKNQPTIDEIRDMIQNDPRYDKLTAAQMDEVVKRETVRADFAYNMGISPEEVDDQIVDMLMMEGYASKFGFNMGGLIPPQKGPMSEGMGTLYRSK
jgi:glycosyltransferase involved in cell wall biosynthesis